MHLGHAAYYPGSMLWDIFCKVIDNWGDVGVCWRLGADLAARGERVRLWVDDPGPLRFMAPGGLQGVEVVPWTAQPPAHAPGDVVVEAFGCDPHPAFLAALAERTRASGRQPAWINLEYLSAQDWAERCHGLSSPVLHGPARGLGKRFFFPGFTPATGGLIREADLAARLAAFDPAAWRLRMGRRLGFEPAAGERLVSLFCYEPAALGALLARLAAQAHPTRLLVTPGRARAAVEAALAAAPGAAAPAISWLPWLTQPEYDELLWACALNFVRGEDSLVRALWAGRPFVWQIYPQDDGAHHAKLEALLDAIGAPAGLRAFHHAWNGLATDLPDIAWTPWEAAVRQAGNALRQQPDLSTQLMQMVARPENG